MKKLWAVLLIIGSVIGAVLAFMLTGKSKDWDKLEDEANKKNEEYMAAEQNKINELKKAEELKDANKKAVAGMDRDKLIDDIIRNI